jgi:ferredoxin-NADP reductase
MFLSPANSSDDRIHVYRAGDCPLYYSIVVIMSRTSGLRARAFRVAELFTTPLLPSDYLDLVNPLRAGAALRGRVVEVFPETRDAVTVVIRPGHDWAGHVPGQYVRIGVDVDGVRQWRAYSLTSNTADATISITVKAIEDGKVSNYLVHRAHPGLLVHLDQATGDFTLTVAPPAKALFIAGGSGITPVMGILRNQIADLGDVTVLHCAASHDEAIFGGELRHLAATGRIRLIENHDDVHGLLSASRLAELVPDLAERATWACGPLGLLDLVEKHFADVGLSEQLHTERFRTALIDAGEGGTVSFTRADVVVEADGATPILEAGEAAGVLMPSGCRMGICFGCVVPLRDGAVRDLRSGDITTAVEGDGVAIQTCISAAAGPCHIDL